MLKSAQEMKLRKFSQKTIKSYAHYITDLLKYSSKNPKIRLKRTGCQIVFIWLQYRYDRHQ